jgi:plastocyanin
MLTLLLTAGLIAACGDDDDDDAEPAATSAGADTTAGSTTPAAGGTTLTISGFAFPDGVTGAAGSTISIVNEDSTTHTVTADDDSFDVEVDGGGTDELTLPDEPGSYAFHCNIHGSMQGTLVVE